MPGRKKVYRRRKPVAKKKTTHVRRRTGARKSKLTNRLTTVCLRKGALQLFPDRMCVKMRNVFQIQFTGAAGVANGYAMMGNGLHASISTSIISGANPWAVGGAVNINGLGNILSADSAGSSAGPYNNYRVISSAIIFKVQMTAGNPYDCANLVILPATGLTQLGNVNSQNAINMAEYPYAKVVTISGQTMNKGVIVRHAMSTARQFALKYKSSLEDPGYTGAYGSNPTNVWYWAIGWFPDTANNTTCTIICQQDYWVEFFNRNSLNGGTG